VYGPVRTVLWADGAAASSDPIAVPERGESGHVQAVAERKAKGGLGVPFRILSTATLRAEDFAHSHLI